MRSFLISTSLLLSLLSGFPKTTKPEGPLGEEVEAPSIAKGSYFGTIDMDKKGEVRKYGAEVPRLLNMFANSIYTNLKVVVRELISNGIDAIEKQHQQALGNAKNGGEISTMDNYEIVVEVDKDSGLLSFTDNGVGMTSAQLESYLGTIARSGSAETVQERMSKGQSASNIIGQFGVGFYSFLLISERAAVVSKNDADPIQHVWEADESATFRIFPDPAGNTLGRGTRVVLKIKESAKEEFLDEDKVQAMIMEFFAHDPHRIFIIKPREVPDDSEKKEVDEGSDSDVEVSDEKKTSESKSKIIYEKVLVSRSVKPVWKRKPEEVKKEEYDALFKNIAPESVNGGYITHTQFMGQTARGEDFGCILFVPEKDQFTAFANQDGKVRDVKLYVRGVFVNARMEEPILPKHLSFIRGVVDSDDLSLNISRDILQNTAELRGIRRKVIKKTVEMLNDMSDSATNDGPASDAYKLYQRFHDAYGSNLKLEISDNEEYRSILAPLLRFNTTHSDDVTTLEAYVSRMGEYQNEQKSIYFLAGQEETIKKSPFLERFKSSNIEVLLLGEPVDEHMMQRWDTFDGYTFVNIAKEGVKLSKDEEDESKQWSSQYEVAIKVLSKILRSDISKIVLVGGPAGYVGTMKSNQFGWTGNMERLILSQATSKEDPMLSFFANQKKILELNPKNELVKSLLDIAADESRKKDPELRVIIRTLSEALLVESGFSVRNPTRMSSNVQRMAKRLLGLKVEPIDETAEAEKEAEEVEAEAKSPFAHFAKGMESQSNNGDDDSAEDSPKKDVDTETSDLVENEDQTDVDSKEEL